MEILTPKNKLAEDVISELRRIGLEPRGYSGRAMYGKECVGVDIGVDPYNEVTSLWTLAQSCPDLPEPNTDSMGHGIIAYWPRAEVDVAYSGED